MIKLLRVDNYKSLVNFEINFSHNLCLLLGPNGVGKSSVFEVLGLLQAFIAQGAKTTELFPTTTLTRWQDIKIQSFELELRTDYESTFRYYLELEHDLEKDHVRIRRETLYSDSQVIYEFSVTIEQGMQVGQVQLYRDDFSKGAHYPFDWHQSGLFHIQWRPDYKKINLFQGYVERILIISLNAPLMKIESRVETPLPKHDLSDFVDWFRYLAQNMGKIIKLSSELKHILEGFESFVLKSVGKGKILQIKFAGFPALSFDEISDGQRALVALYTLIYCLDENQDYTLCIDEPENYLALAEVDPWLHALYDKLQESPADQGILISHHPKFINALAEDSAFWLSKSPTGSTRCQVLNQDNNSGISIADLVERGWIYEQ